MGKLVSIMPEIGLLDTLAAKDSFLHRLDPRAKILTTLAFMVAVVSFDKYQLSALLPFFIFPVVMMSVGGISPTFLARKVLLLLPFILVMGFFNPIYDQTIVGSIGNVAVTGGWLSYFSMVIRFCLTVLAAFILIAVTGFSDVCLALERLGMPRVFAVQLLFLYRYLFVLSAEGGRMARARSLRSFAGKGLGMRVYASLVGHLLLRTFERAQRIYQAMLSRGFRGEFPPRRPLRFGLLDFLFVASWAMLFLLFRVVNVASLLGELISGVML
ncbi:MAG: cobalt ECF transporter T component CbiQ [Geobacter sp.]|nr:cobalt ECF transporter T component CbiQ [Geobacter sp.]